MNLKFISEMILPANDEEGTTGPKTAEFRNLDHAAKRRKTIVQTNARVKKKKQNKTVTKKRGGPVHRGSEMTAK
jgi:hypothetical protein